MGEAARITSKGQLTVPKSVRDRLKLKPGDRVEFVEAGKGYYFMPRNLRAVDLAGILGPPPSGESLTLEQIDEAIGDAVAADDERIMQEWRGERK